MSRYHAAGGRMGGGDERDIGLLEAFGAAELLPLVRDGRLRPIGGDPDEEWGELELVVEGMGSADPSDGTQYLLKVHRDEDIASEAEEQFGPGEGPHQKYNVETETFAGGSPMGGQWEDGFDDADGAIAWIELRGGHGAEAARGAPDAGMSKGAAVGELALPGGAVRLPDNKQWTNRFNVKSETSDRVYTIAQNKKKGHWGCSCPAWRTRRECKHLKALGLPELEEPSPMAVLESPPAAPETEPEEAPAGALALPRGAVKLPDNQQWTNRFNVKSETSDRVYTIAQNKKKGHWGCSCPSWRTRRTCKHLEALGLPELEKPAPIAVLAARIASRRSAATTFRPAPPGAMGPAVQDIWRMVERARVLPDLSATDEAVLSSLVGVFDHTEGVELPDLGALDLEMHDLEAALLRLADASGAVGNLDHAGTPVPSAAWAERWAANNEARAALARSRRGGAKPKATPPGPDV